MAIRIYKSGTNVVYHNLEDYSRREYSNIYYSENDENQYMIYDPFHRVLTSGKDYTDFQRRNGDPFNDNDEFLNYISSVASREVGLNVGAQLDAANRLRVSQQNTLLDIKQINNDAPLFLDRENVGGATQVYDQTRGGTIMSVSTNGDAAISESKMFAPYYSGKGQLLEMTFDNLEVQADVIKRVGYFSSNTSSPFDSDKDGLWLEADGTTHRFIISKGGTETVNIPITEWEPQTQNIDFSKFNVFVIQFLYLGGTAMRFGFFVNGVIEWAYTHIHAGLEDSTFLISPDQPIRYEIRSTGGSGSMDQICMEAASEGSIDEVGVPSSFTAYDFQAQTAPNIYAVLGLRLNTRNIRAIIKSVSFQAENNDDFLYFILLNPTISGDPIVWGNADSIGTINNSVLDVAIGTGGAGGGANLVTDLGQRLEGGSIEGTTSAVLEAESSLHLGSNIDGTPDELWVCVRPRTNGLDVDATINMQEFI